VWDNLSSGQAAISRYQQGFLLSARIMAHHSQDIEQETLRKNLLQLIHLRGMAFYGQLATILTVYYGFNLVIRIGEMLWVTAALVAFNVWALYRYKSKARISDFELFAGLMVDVVAFTAQLYLSGGTSNPFILLYLLPVIIGSVLLKPLYAWSIAASTLVFYAGLSFFRQSYPAAHEHHGGTSAGFDMHVHGMMIAYAMAACLVVFFVSRITANLRARDQELAQLQQQSAENAQIVRMGLLSAGAAHELGTPLTTLSVILKDWHDLSVPRKRAEQLADIQTMQAQLERCKAIITGILSASGSARGEGAMATSLRGFLEQTLGDWQNQNPDVILDAYLEVPEVSVAADRVMSQTLTHLLDNAVEAAGRDKTVVFMARVEADMLILAVDDEGPGFHPDILSRIGEPYLSTKDEAGRSGRGLGLFLGHNTLRSLGGQLIASNRASAGRKGPGARVELRLPLGAILLQEVRDQ
jgi:two-component system sensor histidine kinase RegB